MNSHRATDPVGEWRFPNPATPTGSAAYYSVRFSTPGRRDLLAALFAWRHQVHAVLNQVSDPAVARIKLDWWRSEAQQSLAGEPRHPLSRLIAAETGPEALPAEPFLAIAGVVDEALRRQHSADLQAQRHRDEADLGALFELLAHGAQAPSESLLARRAGGWCAGVRRLRDAGLLARRGREVLPADRLRAAGLDADSLASAEQRARLPQMLAPLAGSLHAARPAAEDRARLPPVLRAQLRIHAALLDELERSGFAVAEQRIGLTPLRKLWLAWRATR